ncbi:zinc-ribbon domain-containing protein [Novosphingobium terrae]|uniref:zinc-ribbon domain-containing protein n=1 Tax=Novosphingobium terrae TaxID=2726189 RepID=UPI00197EBE69|nr:zinc-ribbon domain-containing protein [Novosphingobium terrae]
MIIACPACATRYAVPDNAIGAKGRTVRCAKCRHSWFQDGHGIEAEAPVAAVPVAQPTPAPAMAEAMVAAPEPVAPPPPAPTVQEDWPSSYPVPAPAGDIAVATPTAFAAPVPAYERDKPEAQPAATTTVADDFDDTPSSFAHEPPFRPRRNPARMWTMLAITFGLLALVAAGAVWRFGLPGWLPFGHSPFAAGQPDLVLTFPSNRQDRRSLANGGEYFGISGTITNVGKQRRNVPQLIVVLRDAGGRKVYSWEITPAKRVLAPGESLAVSEAMTDIPRSAHGADIGWKAE